MASNNDPRSGAIAIIGTGTAGLITAHTLLRDGFRDVQLFSRDRSPGGVWAKEHIYPGLRLNSIHGEYRFSSLNMPPPSDASRTGGRLTGEDMCGYMQAFSDKYLKDKIRFQTEILEIRRDEPSGTWFLRVEDKVSGRWETLKFSRIVLCSGGCSNPKIPEYLSQSTALSKGFKGLVIHSSAFSYRLEDILSHVRSPLTPATRAGSVVIIGGGKSAQDIAAYLAGEGCQVTVVYELIDAFTSGPKPPPDFIRKSRLISVFAGNIELRTRLERFLHTTWLGSRIVHHVWNSLVDDSFKAMSIPENSPLRMIYPPFWCIRTNDEGPPRENGFHPLVNSGKIKVVAPVRATGYGPDGRTVRLNNGECLEADLVVLATGYDSSWSSLFDTNTAANIGLHRHLSTTKQSISNWDYASLADPPPTDPRNEIWSSSIYRGIVPAKNILMKDFAINGAVLTTNDGYSMEVTANWISSYFLGDKMILPSSPPEALERAEYDAAWLRKRYPNTLLSINESCSSFAAFWTWPQYCDGLLEDMYLPSMRSGGNWLTWPFKVIHVEELATLHEERAANRMRT